MSSPASILASILGGNAFDGIAKVIDSIKGHSPEQAAALQAAQIDLQKQILQAQSDITKAQIGVDNTEAGHTGFFVAGWRPAIGWVCGTGLLVQFVVNPLSTWIAALAHHPIQFPSLDLGTLMTLLFGMLGLGTMRSYEKVNGVNSGQ